MVPGVKGGGISTNVGLIRLGDGAGSHTVECHTVTLRLQDVFFMFAAITVTG